MKKIVKGNDFTMRIPVVKMVDGEKQAFSAARLHGHRGEVVFGVQPV